MLDALLPVCGKVIVTRPRIDRALKPEVLLAVARRTRANAVMTDSVHAAVARAVAETGPDGVICIAGSLYVVGEAREAFESGAFPVFVKSGAPAGRHLKS
jgi:dihydrofolate synthase/folylpolyglutamate synthase